MLTKIKIKLNKNNEYRNQIEYKTLTLTYNTLLDWHVNILKNKKKLKKIKKIKRKKLTIQGC